MSLIGYHVFKQKSKTVRWESGKKIWKTVSHLLEVWDATKVVLKTSKRFKGRLPNCEHVLKWVINDILKHDIFYWLKEVWENTKDGYHDVLDIKIVNAIFWAVLLICLKYQFTISKEAKQCIFKSNFYKYNDRLLPKLLQRAKVKCNRIVDIGCVRAKNEEKVRNSFVGDVLKVLTQQQKRWTVLHWRSNLFRLFSSIFLLK